MNAWRKTKTRGAPCGRLKVRAFCRNRSNAARPASRQWREGEGEIFLWPPQGRGLLCPGTDRGHQAANSQLLEDIRGERRHRSPHSWRSPAPPIYEFQAKRPLTSLYFQTLRSQDTGGLKTAFKIGHASEARRSTPVRARNCHRGWRQTDNRRRGTPNWRGRANNRFQ